MARRVEQTEPVRVPRALPRGPHSLPREVVVVSQRRRLIEGMVEAVAEKGYADATVADVIARAGVSRTTFYEQFKDKEDCFLACYAEGAELHFGAVTRAMAEHEDPVERLRAAARTYLRVMADEPRWARTNVVEVKAAGRRALALRAEVQRRYRDLLRGWHDELRRERPEIAELPDEVILAAVAAVDELVAARVAAGRAAQLEELEPAVLYIDFALLGLHEEAEAALRRSHQRGE